MIRVCIKHYKEYKDIKRSDIFKYKNGDPDKSIVIDRMLSLTRMIY